MSNADHNRAASRQALWLMLALVPLGPMAIDMFLPAAQSMAQSFALPPQQLHLIVSLYVLALGLVQLMAGWLSDRYGRFHSALLGLALYASASLVIALSDHISWLYSLRVIQGAGAALTMVSSMAWVRDHFDGQEAAKWLSYMGGIASAVPTLAPLLGGLLATAWGWRASFWAMAMIASLLIVLMLPLILAVRNKNQNKDPVTDPVIHQTTPMVEVNNASQLSCRLRDMLQHRHFMLYSLANLFAFAALMTYISNAAHIAVVEGGMSSLNFALVFGAIGAGQVAASFSAPRLMQRIGRGRLVRLGLSVSFTGGLVLFAVMLLELQSLALLLGFFLAAAFAAMGFSLQSGASTALSLESFRYCAGLATSIHGFMRMAGGAGLAMMFSALLAQPLMAVLASFMAMMLPLLLLFWLLPQRQEVSVH